MSITATIRAVPRGSRFMLAIFCSLAVWRPALAQVPELGGGKLPTLAPLVREVTPSIVNLSVQGRVKESKPVHGDPMFREFFDAPKEFERQIRGVGSGVIVDAQQGYVVTASHVVAQASTVQVTTKDGRRFAAKVVGRDSGTDLAVLRLQEAQGLKSIPMGDSDSVEVGDFVIAVGNPFGLGQTVTSGLVSALGRTGVAPQGYEDFIQTDAPINPGNSGGALVNMRGELVGINTAIFSAGGGNVGIGFAVPINMARLVMKQIVENGKVRRGRIGVAIAELNPGVGAGAAGGTAEGALIAGVARGSPAEQGGLQKGDIVVAADGTPIPNAARLRNKLGLTPVGERLQLTVNRKGAVHDISVEVAPEDEKTNTIRGSRPAQPRAAWNPRRPPP
jgi:serine protease Do